jgi:hypothetical protein
MTDLLGPGAARKGPSQVNKVSAGAAEAIADITDGASLAVGGFGLSGVPDGRPHHRRRGGGARGAGLLFGEGQGAVGVVAAGEGEGADAASNRRLALLAATELPTEPGTPLTIEVDAKKAGLGASKKRLVRAMEHMTAGAQRDGASRTDLPPEVTTTRRRSTGRQRPEQCPVPAFQSGRRWLGDFGAVHRHALAARHLDQQVRCLV